MDRVLLLERFRTCYHLLILNFLEFEVDSLNHNLVSVAKDLQHLALTLLVTTGDHLDLLNKRNEKKEILRALT